MENFEIMSADDFFSKYGELAGQRLMFGRPAAVKHCSANVFGDCVAGTLLIPDKKDTEKVRLRCGFRLDGERISRTKSGAPYTQRWTTFLRSHTIPTSG